jgi:vitamin B6-dependent photo-protection and homoeostasis protein
VGDEKSHPTTALLLSVFQESFGRIVTIIFAHRFGSALEPECKMWRFAADIFNDVAFILDCLSPAFPKQIRVFIFSGASMLRALCGVAAGSAKASLSAHFAKAGNLGDVNAVSLWILIYKV